MGGERGALPRRGGRGQGAPVRLIDAHKVPPDDHRPHRLADGLNHPANVGSITTGLATALGMPREALAQRVAENFGRWWGI